MDGSTQTNMALATTHAHKHQDRVIHVDADITLNSVTNVSPGAIGSGQSTQSVPRSHKPEDEESRKRAADMREWWDEGISKNMDLPDGYEKVAVLLIRWHDELDDLSTRAEKEELEAVFHNRFYFDTETAELNVSSKPGHQLNRHLTAFVEKHDSPTTLLIIYYTGHGVYREDRKFLELTATKDPDSLKGSSFNNEARANWNTAEKFLRSEAVESDVLTILDTCYASNHTKSGHEDNSIFELLSACAINNTTAAPGANSFTRALIVALEKLLTEYGDKPFTTSTLNQTILKDPNRHDSPSQLWVYNERHIRLAPLKPRMDRRRKPFTLSHPPRGYLTLRFALRDSSLNREQIEFFTKKLSEAFNNKQVIGLRRIDWLGLQPARTTPFGRAALALFAITQWKNFVKKRRMERQKQRAVDDIILPMNMSISRTDTFLSSPSRKRSRGGLEDLPESKRGVRANSLSQDNPPSPPVSNSSLVDDLVDIVMNEDS